MGGRVVMPGREELIYRDISSLNVLVTGIPLPRIFGNDPSFEFGHLINSEGRTR